MVGTTPNSLAATSGDLDCFIDVMYNSPSRYTEEDLTGFITQLENLIDGTYPRVTTGIKLYCAYCLKVVKAQLCARSTAQSISDVYIRRYVDNYMTQWYIYLTTIPT